MNRTLILPCAVIAALAGTSGVLCADELAASASHGGNEIKLYTSPLAYEVVSGGKTVVAKTPVSMTFDGVSCADAKAHGVRTRLLSGVVETPVYKKKAVDLSGSETSVDFGDFAVRLVARRDGVAYRFETKKAVEVTDESAPVTIPSKSARCWFNRTPSGNWGAEETVPEFSDAGELKGDPRMMYYMPFAYGVDGKFVAVTDSDIGEYSAWYFKGVSEVEGGVRLESTMDRYPKRTERVGGWNRGPADRGLEKGGRWIKVRERENFLVKAEAARSFPWRSFIIADTPAALAASDLVFALAAPQCEKADFSWVKPGKVAWDWWNCFDNIGDPEGCTTKTYERFIDFAAKNGVEYVILDEGWSAALDIWTYSPVVDVPHIIEYGRERGVGIILWMAWAQAYGDEERVVEHFAKLGAKGFKVDFIDRADARAGQFYTDFARVCAKYKMLVDYHGATRPSGLHRRFPNVLNYEGIHGLEQMKWAKSDKDMPLNDVACCFLRMAAGPMDYTPGAMLNHPYGKYTAGAGAKFPGSVGTRAHQMAMMAAYEAPLQMLSDSPTNYEKNMESFTFMSKVPVVWDDTVGVAGCPESFVVMARKARDGSWYVSGLNNKDAKKAEFKTCFLGSGAWKVELFRDSEDGATAPQKYVHEEVSVVAGDTMSVEMAPGGGFVARFVLDSAATEALLASRLPAIFGASAAHYKALDESATALMQGADGKLRVPHSFYPSTGKLDMREINWWTTGHYPGSLWYLYEATGDAFFRDRATVWTELLEPNKTDSSHHDTGFMMYCSYGNARRLLGTDKYDGILLETANSLSKRFNGNLGLIRSWGHISDKKDFLVIPDNMMNLELLEWASKNGGEDAKRFDTVARSHASVTMGHHFRKDGGTYHVLNYSQEDGRVQQIWRGQGASCESAWSRGQSWAIYGYTMMYRETGDRSYLAFAQKVADYAIAHPNMPADGVPYWDFGAPGEERDSSAAAVMASGLLELSTFVGGEKGAAYRTYATRQLLSLASPRYFSKDAEIGHWLLKHGVGHKPEHSEIDVPLDYGDYYFLEALLRFRALAK